LEERLAAQRVSILAVEVLPATPSVSDDGRQPSSPGNASKQKDETHIVNYDLAFGAIVIASDDG
jgi:hypothetical protein